MKNTIRELRLQSGLTQHQLGQLFKDQKDITVISRWERNVVQPSTVNLLELARIFKVSPNDIVFEINKTDLSV
ncbi:helix-turn-helix transcriptional regulator [Bacillus sp. 03113]|uniref:helix-turn-helix transcriptional regulator n=1 Tax=Bacillus sp. 03113 TaxID=2578211 RepID=UPI0011434700|nr:helix-turn-helix transcriptional regulator [Bacillus sp. 03113]